MTHAPVAAFRGRCRDPDHTGATEFCINDIRIVAGLPSIVGNYLTNLGRLARQDLDMLAELKMPIRARSETQ